MSNVNIVVRQSVGWDEQICLACGQNRTEYTELHLRHSGQKIILCTECDDGQLTKPRMISASQSGR